MIIGRYSVNPLDVEYGSYRFEPETQCYEFSIHINASDVSMDMTQVDSKKDTIDKWMKQVDKCVNMRKDAMLEGAVGNDSDDEGGAL
jgi:hypothetical protein